MLTAFLIIMMLVVFGKLAALALRAAWGIVKILFVIIFLPAAILSLAAAGFIGVSFIALIGAGAVALIAG